ncbi:MAG: M57 family metalloprotease, partial [Bacteroidales bacterium]|nr:M57 family metalloprotease [Bacteroidales bacterium]
MKLTYVLAILILVSLISCERNEPMLGETNQGEVYVHEFDEMEILGRMGFEQNDISDMGEFFLLEDDIVLSKSGLLELLRNNSLKHAYIGDLHLVDPSNKDIKIYIDVVNENQEIKLTKIVNEVIAEYNSLDTYLKFMLTNDTTQRDITIRIDELISHGYAFAKFADKGKPGDTIIIDEATI